MRRCLAVGLAVLGAAAGAQALDVPFPTAAARMVVVAPHPDDESLGAGGLLARLDAAGVPAAVVTLTYGDGWPWAAQVLVGRPPTDADYVAMGRIRQRELLAALGVLGLEPRALSLLGFPDGALDVLWTTGWSGAPTASPTTGARTVPYADAVDPHALYTGDALVAVLARVFAALRPTVLVLPHPADVHPDHAATPRFVAAALGRLRGRGVLPPKVRLLTYLVHHAVWPPSAADVGEALPPPTRAEVPATRWTSVALTPAEAAAKRRAIEAHATQIAASPDFLRKFERTTEPFGRVKARVWVDARYAH